MTRFYTIVAVCLALVGCAGTSTLTRRDVLRQYDQVAALSAGVADASGRHGALLAPRGFERAQQLLEDAVGYAQAADKTMADQTARQGLDALAQVNRSLTIAQEEMQEVLTTRERAVKEGAEALRKKEFADVDQRLRAATELLEAGEMQKAREQRPALMERYAAMELAAIETGVIEGAQIVVDEAEKAGADDYAPRTLSEAREELRLTSAVLEGDRTRREEAEEHARRAIWLAGRAKDITDLAKKFDEEEYALEDILLWHQSQLEVVNEPLTTPLPFDESDRVAVLSLRKSIQSLLAALDDARGTTRKNEQEIATLQKNVADTRMSYEKRLAEFAEASGKQLTDLKSKYETQLSEEARKQQEAERRRVEAEQRFRRAEALFKPEEATVVRQGENVRLDVHGFDFPPGSSTIGSVNFGLLDRIVSAIRTFPESKVRVGGHTDSLGSDARNLKLSIARAAGVAEFLMKIGGIDRSRVESDGYGESKPVASNQTKGGRAKNRRVEILIVNQ